MPMTRKSRRALGLAALLFALSIGFIALLGYRLIFHVAENSLAADACKNAIGASPTADLATLVLSSSIQVFTGATVRQEDGGMSEVPSTADERQTTKQWWSCIEEERPTCGPHTAAISGLFSALPNRYWIRVKTEDGIVKECQVSGAPGW